MLVYWDANVLTAKLEQGIVVYAVQLLRALQQFDDLNFVGLIKLSRLKRVRNIKGNANLPIRLYTPPLSDWILNKKAVFHGIDFKVPNTKRLPRVVTIHDFGVFADGLSDPRFRANGMAYLTWLLTKVNPERIIVPTESVKSHMLQHFPDTLPRIRVIPHGVDQVKPTLRDITKTPTSISQFVPFILCPGSVEKRKNPEMLIKAFENARISSDVNLVFAGIMGFEHEAILAKANTSMLSRRIHFLNGVDRPTLNMLYEKALFTVYPSLLEGFGLPILEAFALGSPLITSNFGAMAEVAGDAALVVDTRSVDALSEGLDLLASDPDLRKTLSNRGKIRASAYTWKRSATETREVYLELSN